MGKKRKYKKGDIRLSHIAKLLSLLLVFSIIVLGIRHKKEAHVDKITVGILPLPENKFLITTKEVYNIISEISGFDIERARLKDFNLRAIESKLKKDGRIKNVLVYINKKNELRIQIVQRNPIVRIDISEGPDIYLDDLGVPVPVFGQNLIRVPVATGDIDKYTPDYKTRKKHTLKSVFELSKEIYDDQFLSSLVEQIHVRPSGELVVVPKIGRSKLIIGDADNYTSKLNRLKEYYKEGIQIKGIETYAELDLSWDGQIVGRK